MWVVRKVYDDGTYDLFDICTGKCLNDVNITKIRKMCEAGTKIYGTVSVGTRIEVCSSYGCMEVESYDEAERISKENRLLGISSSSLELNNRYWVMVRSSAVYHVKYYVGYRLADEDYYILEDGKSVSLYKNNVKDFGRDSAYATVQHFNKIRYRNQNWTVYKEKE